MRGGRNNFNGELVMTVVVMIIIVKFWLDRGGGNRGRYGNFSDDNNRDEGFSGGRQNYGQQRDGNNYGNREERYNNYGNRGSHNRGGGGGSGYEQERRTSESMSQLSLEGKSFVIFRNAIKQFEIFFRTGRWSTKVEFGTENC